MEEIELTLTGHAYLGRALGRDDQGRMVFVPFALPGERVHVEIVDGHKRWARARLLEILEASPARISPRCCHFTDCGGCHYQHLAYADQLLVKSEVVREQLARIGGFPQPPVEPTIPSPSPWNTRNHIQFSLNTEGRLGFHAAESNQIVPIKECFLPDSDLADLWPRIHLEPTPEITRVALRAGTEGDRMIVLHGEKGPAVEVEMDLPASVVWLGSERAQVLAGDGHLLIEILGVPFLVSAGSFFQVHTRLAEELVRHVMVALDPRPGEVIYDLYAGVGLFSAFIAEAGARVIGVEASAQAGADFETNLDDYTDVELYVASVERALPALTAHPDGMIVDPPRAGLGREVVQALVDLSPSRLIYVSCDPATLARDAKMLAGSGYHLESVRPFDLFPQTYHIETLSFWSR